MPKVTVLMSVYNGDKFLREAVDSVMEQTYADFEFLIIDDCSSDSSPNILASYSDPRMRVVRNESNLGLTKSLNKGIGLAEGKYVARMDADDIAMPDRLARQVEYLDAHPECGLVASLYETIDDTGIMTRSSSDRSLTSEELYVGLIFINCFPHSASTFLTQAVREIGGYNETFKRSQDMDLWFRLSRKHGIYQLPDVLLRYRNTKSNISNAFKNEQMNNARQIYFNNLIWHLGENAPVDDLACFEGLMIFHQPLKVTPRSISAYRRLSEAVISSAPECLDRVRVSDGLNHYLGSVGHLLIRYRPTLIFNCYMMKTLWNRFATAVKKRLR